MSVDIHVTAGCGCFLTELGPVGIAVAMCKGHTARARLIFDREPDAVDQLLAGVYTDQEATMTTTSEAIAAVRALHKPVPANEGCDSETWSTDHYGQAVDPYWIRCGRHGEHAEHGDDGNTGCTWPLTDADRKAQEQLPHYCDECNVGYPCPTIAALAGVGA